MNSVFAPFWFEPLNDALVELSRMINIVCPGHHQNALAAKLGRIGDLELTAADIAALIQQPPAGSRGRMDATSVMRLLVRLGR
jgi:hypothetical protein